jgi:hypothetical protein
MQLQMTRQVHHPRPLHTGLRRLRATAFSHLPQYLYRTISLHPRLKISSDKSAAVSIVARLGGKYGIQVSKTFKFYLQHQVRGRLLRPLLQHQILILQHLSISLSHFPIPPLKSEHLFLPFSHLRAATKSGHHYPQHWLFKSFAQQQLLLVIYHNLKPTWLSISPIRGPEFTKKRKDVCYPSFSRSCKGSSRHTHLLQASKSSSQPPPQRLHLEPPVHETNRRRRSLRLQQELRTLASCTGEYGHPCPTWLILTRKPRHRLNEQRACLEAFSHSRRVLEQKSCSRGRAEKGRI